MSPPPVTFPTKALDMYENIKTIRPLKDGVIADFDASEQMINLFIKSIPTLKKKIFSKLKQILMVLFLMKKFAMQYLSIT